MKEFLRLVWFGVAAGCTIFTVIGVILALILDLSEWRPRRW